MKQAAVEFEPSIPVLVLLHKYNIPTIRTQSSLNFEFIKTDMFQPCTSLPRASSHATTELLIYKGYRLIDIYICQKPESWR